MATSIEKIEEDIENTNYEIGRIAEYLQHIDDNFSSLVMLIREIFDDAKKQRAKEEKNMEFIYKKESLADIIKFEFEERLKELIGNEIRSFVFDDNIEEHKQKIIGYMLLNKEIQELNLMDIDEGDFMDSLEYILNSIKKSKQNVEEE